MRAPGPASGGAGEGEGGRGGLGRGRGRVVVVGSINVDLVVTSARLPAPGETVAGGVFSRGGGGKSANQAVAAARLGASVALVGAVGEDDLGAEARDELAAEGIDLSGVARLAGEPTGVALIAVDAAGENQISVASGANAALDPEWVAGAVAGSGSGAGAHADSGAGAGAEAGPDPGSGAGVALLGFEIGDAAVLAGARAAAARGLRLVVNPAPARPLPAELTALGPLLTPNATEARDLTGEADPQAAARALVRQTGAPVAITLGGDGVLLLADADGEPQRIPAPPVEVVDTTGAGDTFNGALATELARGAGLEEAVAFAVAAASLATRSPGARGGMPARGDVVAPPAP